MTLWLTAVYVIVRDGKELGTRGRRLVWILIGFFWFIFGSDSELMESVTGLSELNSMSTCNSVCLKLLVSCFMFIQATNGNVPTQGECACERPWQ